MAVRKFAELSGRTDMNVIWPLPREGVNEDGFGWLFRAEKKCVLSWKKYTASLKITTSNHWEFPNEVAPAGELIVWLLTGNKSMNSRSSWGCEPIRKQRMRHKGHEGEN